MVRIIARGPDVRLPRIKGRLQVKRVRGGGYALSGPSLALKGKVPAHLAENVTKFKEAQRAIQQMAPTFVRFAMEVSPQTQFLWRDLLLQALYGRGVTIYDTDGNVWYAMASRDDLNTLLDVLTRTPGAMFYRASQGWVAIPPGNPGNLLWIDPDTGVPAWAEFEPSGADGFTGFSSVGISLNGSTSNYATKGIVVTPSVAVEIDGFMIPVDQATSARTYRVDLWSVDTPGAGMQLQSQLATSAVQSPGAVSEALVLGEFTAPALLAPATPYLLAMRRVDSTGTAPNGALLGSGANGLWAPNAPLAVSDGAYQYNTTALSPGQTPSAVGTATYVMALKGRSV